MLGEISVVVVTKNEEPRLGDCLKALHDFDDVWVVDSASDDRTAAIAREHGATVIDFIWNGAYPKKRQWCLDNLRSLRDWVFWVDADEVLSSELVAEIAGLDGRAAGYFVKGKYVYDGVLLRHGLVNHKIALMDKTRMEFPVVDDLDLESMGEIEGHYQPVIIEPQEAQSAQRVGILKNSLIHHAYNENWEARHLRYAKWQREVEARGALPVDDRWGKRLFMALPLKPLVAFVHCYVWKLGFLDGAAGFKFALSRARYYGMISVASKDLV